LKVRITQQPRGIIHGLSLHYYREGYVYDLPASVGEYLVTEGFAIIEMRNQAASRYFEGPERRQKPK
jgi:hypothetical protein